MTWDGQNRRENGGSHREEVEQRIAGKAAEKAAEIIKQWVFTEIGRATFRAVILLIGTLGVLAVSWFGLAEKVIGK